MPATILIVDDEKNIRRTVRMVLEGEGFGVEEAGSGEEALARLPDVGADVMLLDVQLPGMSGLETLERLRDKPAPPVVSDKAPGRPAEPPLPTVVMISGHATLADAVRAVKSGAYDLLEKPLDRERLLVTIRNALERRAMASEVAGLRRCRRRALRDDRRSAPMRALSRRSRRSRRRARAVLITGESGTGKELIARAIHRSSPLASAPFVKVNCAAIPPELIESELFGHERGAFTGAIAKKRGLFEVADGGTIFLDEIGDMALSAQAKVLRVLQTGEFTRGWRADVQVEDVRVIAATNQDLQAAVTAGQFRSVLPMAVVPLRALTHAFPRGAFRAAPRSNQGIDLSRERYATKADFRRGGRDFGGGVSMARATSGLLADRTAGDLRNRHRHRHGFCPGDLEGSRVEQRAGERGAGSRASTPRIGCARGAPLPLRDFATTSARYSFKLDEHG